jgi:diguanylate cyclase (GGDEF)-like protein
VKTSRAAQLLEANEQLVLAVIRAQDEAEQAAQALKEASRSTPPEARGGWPDGIILFDRLTRALAQAQRSGVRLALLYLSIDNFRELSDTLGHARGGQVLQLAARRLAGAVREADAVSRHGGHEFVILQTVSHAFNALAMADTLIDALALPGQVDGHTVNLKASVGISVFPDDGSDADALIDRATAAMYSARRRGLGVFFFRGEEATSERSLELRISESLQQPVPPAGSATETDEGLAAQQREANEQLLLAALRAQELLTAAELAYRRQTEFLGVVAHELRAPLGPISNAAALLARVRSEEPVLPMVRGVIERQVAQMNRLVADLLDMTRISTGKLRVELHQTDMVPIVQEALEIWRPVIEGHLQSLEVELPAGAIMINGDGLRLGQVVGNLLGNSSKYTPRSGAIRLVLAENGASMALTISDNGIGITPEALPHVFDPFVQERHAMEFNASGLGIGLTLVRELVHAHAGEVSAYSAGPGHGSRFTVTLPLPLPRPDD